MGHYDEAYYQDEYGSDYKESEIREKDEPTPREYLDKSRNTIVVNGKEREYTKDIRKLVTEPFYDDITELGFLSYFRDVLPPLPQNLVKLSLGCCFDLKKLPELPNSLTELTYSNCGQLEITKLHEGLKTFVCNESRLTKLPNLPDSLEHLQFYDNNISEIPNIPRNLKKLYCPHNKLNSIPELPKTVKSINCRYNNLASFPIIPEGCEIKYDNNPICKIMKKRFDPVKTYIEFERITKRKYVRKIEAWFLECKYNPEYEYCRKRLRREYNELHNE